MMSIIGLLIWIGNPSLDDSDPWPAYLDENRLRDELMAVVHVGPDCDEALPAFRQRITLRLDDTGQTQEVSPSDVLPGCWQTFFEGLNFGFHPERQVVFGFTLMVQDDRSVSIVALERDGGDPISDFVHLPLGMGAGDIDALHRALGLAFDALPE